MADKDSGFKLMSLGIVLKDRVRGNDTIEVSPIEHFNLDSGAISADSRKLSVSLPDQHGVSKSTSLVGGSVVKAKWTPDGDNHLETPPDVVAGESVKIYTFGDTNLYYWTTIFREPGLRRLERVRYVFSNQPFFGKAYDENSSYWMEYSTFDKRVKLHTSDNDGEACTYDFEFDTKAGVFSLKDNVGNSIELDSTAGKITGTATEEIEMVTKKATVTADEFRVAADKSIFTGPVVFEKGFSTEGAVTGPVHFEGNVTSDGTILDSSGNSNHHSHD